MINLSLISSIWGVFDAPKNLPMSLKFAVRVLFIYFIHRRNAIIELGMIEGHGLPMLGDFTEDEIPV